MIEKKKSLLEALSEAGEGVLSVMMRKRTVEERVTELIGLTVQLAVQFKDAKGINRPEAFDEMASKYPPLIAVAIDECHPNQALLQTPLFQADAEELRKADSDFRRHQIEEETNLGERLEDHRLSLRFDAFLELFSKLPKDELEHHDDGRRFPKRPLLKTREAVVREVLICWSQVGSDDLAQSFWERFLATSSCFSEACNYGGLLPDTLKIVTDKRVRIPRLDRAILSLGVKLEDSIERYPVLKTVCIRRQQSEFTSVLQAARARNLSWEKNYREIAILAPLHSSSGAAYEAAEVESKRIAAQDDAGKKLLRMLKGEEPGFPIQSAKRIGGKMSLHYPDRSTIEVRILWDEEQMSLFGSNPRIPVDAELHRNMETAVDLAATWRKGNEKHQMKVVIRIMTRVRYSKDGPKEFRKEIVC